MLNLSAFSTISNATQITSSQPKATAFHAVTVPEPITPSKSVIVSLSKQAQEINAIQQGSLIATGATPANYTASSIAAFTDSQWLNSIKSASLSPFTVEGKAEEISGILDRLQLGGAKVLKIFMSDQASSSLSLSAGQLAADAVTLKKIDGAYKLNVTGVTAGKATTTAATRLAVGTTSLGTVATMSLSDTAVGLSATNIAAIKSLVTAGKISSITQTDSSTAKLSLTEQQMTDNATALSLLDSSAKINVTNVAFANRDAVLAKSNVASIGLSATKANVSGAFIELKTKISDGKLTAITLTGSDTNFSLSADDIIVNSAVFEKISSTFSLTATDTTISATSLAGMSSKIVAALKGPMKVSGSASEVSGIIDKLNTLGAKVTDLTVSDKSDTPMILTATQFNASTGTLNKIAGSYTIAVTDVLAANAAATAAKTLSNKTNLSSGAVASITIKDTADNIVKSLAALGATAAKITTIAQSDYATKVMALTAAQLTSNSVALSKLDANARLNITSVSYDKIENTLAKANVVSVGLTMTPSDVALNLADLKSKIGSSKISGIALPTGANTLTLSAGDFAENGAVLGKITSNYKLALSSSTITAAQLANLDTSKISLLPTSAKLIVTGASDDIKANLDKLQALVAAKKIDKVSLSGDINIKLGFADIQKYATTLATFDQKKVTAQFSGNYSQYTVVEGANGSFAITDKRTVAKKESGTLAGVNFFQFADITSFASSGDSNVDALLNGGQNMWWYNGAGAAASTDSISGGFTMLASGSSKTSITYSFLTRATVDPTATAAEKAMTEMNDTQKQGVRNSFAYLASLINVTFAESSDSGKADINFGMNIQTGSAGYANPPHASGGHPSYLFLASNQTTNNTFDVGTYGWETLVHEIGHTMGLKHPFNGNAGGGGAPQPYLPTATNNRNFSIMSYTDASNVNDVNVTYTAGKSGSYSYSYTQSAVNPQTYMTYDIKALQFLYGKNADEGATKITFASNYKGIQTIYAPNAGTIDASATNQNNTFDLRDGAYSSIGYSMKDKITSQLKTQGASDSVSASVAQAIMTKLAVSAYSGANTIGLASGSHINSVLGGSAYDKFYANGVDDVNIDGGASEDTVYLAGASADWSLVGGSGALSAGGGSLAVSAKLTNGKETLNLVNVEKYAFYNSVTSPLTHTA